MINVLQKVTTFPLEMIQFPEIMSEASLADYSNNAIHNYYTNPTTRTHINDKGPLTDDQIKSLNPSIDPTVSKEKIMQYKKRFIVYNAIYNKLFANSLNLLDKLGETETTVVVFPTMNQSDKGSVELNINPNANRYYYEKFKTIYSNTNKDIIINKDKKIYYVELVVFNNEKKEEYAQTIKSQLNEIKKNIIEYNKRTAKQTEINPDFPSKTVQNILFIMDTDKKGLFTGFYKKQLSKEKQDILNKEYTSFLSSSEFTVKKIVDAAVNLTFSEVVKESKLFTSLNGIKIGPNILTNDSFDKFITTVKELYKKNIDKEYKKSLELNDNVKKVKIFYKLQNADKILEDKIQTGSNKLYSIYEKKYGDHTINIIGYFLLVSEERGIYRFKEDNRFFKTRQATEKAIASGTSAGPNIEITGDQNNQRELEVKNENKDEENKELEHDKSEEGAYDFTVQIKNKFGLFKYKIVSNQNDEKYKKVQDGEAIFRLDKTEGSFKWFNLRDIDASLLNKDVIKYYSDILFDKKTLIEYLKSKQKYNDKSILSYEFLKINDSQELAEYCDFIHKNYKSNTKDSFDFNPFKTKFNDKTIIKNVLDIVFDSNTPIYLRASKQTKEEARTVTNDSYKIVEYKLWEDLSFNDESCKDKNITVEPNKSKPNKCEIEYLKGDKENNIKIENTTCIPIKVIVTKTNLKDVGQLKSKTDCKTKKTKIVYDYKKLFQNVTRHIGLGYFGGSKIRLPRTSKFTRTTKNKSRKRRLKTKGYK